jgi:hypothetical protein
MASRARPQLDETGTNRQDAKAANEKAKDFILGVLGVLAVPQT